MPARRSAQGTGSATRPAAPEADEALRRLGDGLAKAGWAVALTGDDGRVIWANGPMRELVGAEAEAAWPGATLQEHLVTDPDLPLPPGVGGIVSPRSGARRWFRQISVPWDGRSLHLLQECSSEVLAERERSRRDVYLTRAVEDSVDAILTLDGEGRIQYWNHGAERLFKYEASEVLGRPYDLLVPEALAREGELDRIAEIIHQQGDLRNFETLRLAGDGKLVEVDISVTQIRDEAGRPLGRSVIYRDISLRRRLEEEQRRLREELSAKVSELRAANRTLRNSQEKLLSMEKLSAIGEMAAKVAHEIRTPLVTIGGFSNTLWKSMPPDAPQREYLSIIRDEVRRLEDIVAEILDYVRPGPLEAEPCEVNQLAQDALRPHLEQIQEAGIHLDVRLQPDLPAVHVNRTQIRQVLTNLIVNAMQAVRDRPHPHQPRIVVVTGEGRNHVVVSVSDNGTGIPERHRERVFRAFFTTKPGGSGLGLAIASKIAMQHRGTLTFESDPGHGTTFHLRLPCGAPPTPGSAHEDDPGG